MYNKILIAVDGSESNNIAVDQGLCLAKSLKAGSVTAICVFDEGNYSTVIRTAAPSIARSWRRSPRTP